jgi:hypothetical protein
MDTKEIFRNVYLNDIIYESVVKEIIKTNLFTGSVLNFFKKESPKQMKVTIFRRTERRNYQKKEKRIHLLNEICCMSYVAKCGSGTSS